MIYLSTNCSECIHKDVCRHRNNATYAMNKLKGMTYGDGPNDDYDWDTMMQVDGVDIEFKCSLFRRG